MNKNTEAIPYGNNCLGLENGKLVIKEKKQCCKVTIKARVFETGSFKIDSNETNLKDMLRPLRGKNVLITFEEDKK